jgi:replicative DNA helicase
MNRDDAKIEIQKCLADYLTGKGINPNKPFHCLNPAHPDRTPSMSYDKRHNRVHCFSCQANYDIFDIIGIDYGLPGFNDQFNKACELYGITTDKQPTRPASASTPKPMPQDGPDIDCSPTHDFFLQSQQAIASTDYPARRGLSAETCKRFKLGFCAAWKHPGIDPAKRRYVPASPRLIIPTGDGSYLARDTRPTLTVQEKRYSKSKVGHVQLFNLDALTADEPPFIVEGEIDAMSIEELGHPAVALGSTSMVKSFLQYVEEHKPTYPVIIALDADESGKRAADELEQGMNGKFLSCYRADGLYTHGKDANENLLQDKDSFNERLETAQNEAIAKQEEWQEEMQQEYRKNSVAGYLDGFVEGITARANIQEIDTGFTNLNTILDGGLYEGLYVIGAISSLGKTTFSLQMGDQIARTGKDVLIFSLEMARAELMAKSISRLTYELIIKHGGSTRDAKTTRGILNGKRWKNYSPAEKKLINEAIDEYKSYAGHIQIFEGMGNITAAQIRENVQRHISITGNHPVVIIDYLQILAPYDVRATDKQNTDMAVLELKRISRDYQLPVMAISSFNRENYKNAVGMQAFKESGAIEYSSDVLIGLQLKGVGSGNFDVDQAKRKNPRDVELVILKNRNGRTNEKVHYEYYPMFNFFHEKEIVTQ